MPAGVSNSLTGSAEACQDRTLADGSPGAANKQATPGMQVVDLGGGVQVQQPCGLVSNEVFSPGFESDFLAKVCNIADGQVTTECTAKLMDMFMARLSERYVGADWNAVTIWCRAYPVECKDSPTLERKLLASHNEGVKRWYASAAAAAQANFQAQAMQQAFLYQQTRAADAQERAAAAEERRTRTERIRQIWGVHCTSTTTGSFTNTNCN